MSLRLMRRLSRPQNAQATAASVVSRKSFGGSANLNDKNDEKPKSSGLAEKLKKQKQEKSSPDLKKLDASDKLGNLLQQMKQQTEAIKKEKKETMEKIKLSQPPPPSQKKSEKPSMSKLGLDPEITEAASEAAEHIGKTVQGAKPEAVKNDLMSRLRMIQKETTSTTQQPDDGPKDKPAFDKSLFGNMKVLKEPKEKKELTQEQKDFLEMRRKKRSGQAKGEGEKIINVESIEPLDEILKFADVSPAKEVETEIKYYKMLEERHLRIIKKHYPRNYIEEMINWTEKGILWKFPIDNEQDLNLVEPFHQHVFLERHLEGWCPKRGPLRRFMELVCVGLQNNPYISVQTKLDHIQWFKDYFGEKTKAEIIEITHGEN